MKTIKSVAKQATLMRRSVVLIFPLQLEFPAVTYHTQHNNIWQTT